MTTADTVSPVVAAYEQVIENGIRNHPRSLQKRIGPSEIGIDCDRRLLHKLAQDPEPDRGIAWKPELGTAMHEHLERMFQASNTTYDPMVRWLTEQKVTVGYIGDRPITGSCDLFDTYEQVVYDHKIVGNSTLTKYRLHGPSHQYRVQANLYGLGWVLAGYQPTEVAICFLPREAEWSKRYIWHEPFNPTIAGEALAHANQLWDELQTDGLQKALTKHPLCDFPFCPWCAPQQRAAKRQAAPNLFET